MTARYDIPPPDIVLVLTGSRREWLDYVSKLEHVSRTDPARNEVWTWQPKLSERHVLVDRIDDVIGFRGKRYVVHGTFWERKDAGDLFKEVKRRIL
jgi:hypothetical protein